MKRCLVNGFDKRIVDAADRGLHYGDGLFETLAVFDGRPRNWQLHTQRLLHGCEQLALAAPDPEMLSDEIARVTLDMSTAVVKIILSRDSAGRGYQYANSTEPTRVIASYDWPEYPDGYYQQGVRLKVCDTRISIQPALAGIKHLNRLENVLARNEWQDDSYGEGLMLDVYANVIEGTMSNLFWVEGKQLYTPKLTLSGVHGIMRQRVIDTASALAISCDEVDADLQRIRSADELFVTNSIIGIWPATLAQLPARGELTSRIMKALAETDGIVFK
jgi:4-amino-4-deoxychorismate lyase